MSPQPLPPQSILVVDDQAVIRQVLAVALRCAGFAVHLAADGREALMLYQQHGPEISAVLLDVRMPGLDGPCTLAALQSLDPGVRCCFMSADTGEYPAEELLQRGAVHFFRKPFRLEELTRALQEMVFATPE